MPVVAVAAAAFAVEAAVTVTTFFSVLTAVGAVATAVGSITGSKDLMKIGAVIGIAGGIGQLAQSAGSSAAAAGAETTASVSGSMGGEAQAISAIQSANATAAQETAGLLGSEAAISLPVQEPSVSQFALEGPQASLTTPPPDVGEFAAKTALDKPITDASQGLLGSAPEAPAIEPPAPLQAAPLKAPANVVESPSGGVYGGDSADFGMAPRFDQPGFGSPQSFDVFGAVKKYAGDFMEMAKKNPMVAASALQAASGFASTFTDAYKLKTQMAQQQLSDARTQATNRAAMPTVLPLVKPSGLLGAR